MTPFQMPNSGFSMPDNGSGLFNAAGFSPDQINYGGGFGGMKSLMSSGPAQDGGLFGFKGLGKNMATINAGLSGVQTLAGLWGALKAADVAKKQLAFTKATTNANLANQTQSYNTGIADRARARGAFEGQSQSQVSDYITQNSLAKRTV